MIKKLCTVILLLAAVTSGQSNAEEAAMTALVTGANRGIGLELVKQLKAQGHQVIGTARKPAQATELQALGARVLQLDVTDGASVTAMADALEGQPIDLLINNAGIGGHTADSFEDTEFDQIGLTFDVNSLGPMRVTQALLPNVLASKQKKVVHISSIMGSIETNQGGYYGYRASKTALNMLNKSLALELQDRGVTAVVLHPGWVKTRMGGPGAAITTDVSVTGLLTVIAGLGTADTGRFLDYQGNELPW